MSSTYCNLLYHIVFSTKHRKRFISPEWSDQLHAYLATVLRGERGIALSINGPEDHIHILARLRQDHCLAKLVAHLKATASGWVHRTFPTMPDFAWQTGYGAFTVSESQASAVKRYVDTQSEHHQHLSFKDEFLEFLTKNRLEYNERYIWS